MVHLVSQLNSILTKLKLVVGHWTQTVDKEKKITPFSTMHMQLYLEAAAIHQYIIEMNLLCIFLN